MRILNSKSSVVEDYNTFATVATPLNLTRGRDSNISNASKDGGEVSTDKGVSAGNERGIKLS